MDRAYAGCTRTSQGGLFSSVQIREANDQNDARRKKQNFGSGCDNSEQHEQLDRPAVFTN
jgi:hypothetical protein